MSERAQETFKTMLRDQVAPQLRILGFKGSGQVYAWPSETSWASLGFQSSVYSDRTTLRFTINLSVVGKAAWAAKRETKHYLPDRPAANTRYGPPAWEQRIGRLLPGGEDKWWTLRAGSDTAQLADEVVSIIRAYALPAMMTQLRYASDAHDSQPASG